MAELFGYDSKEDFFGVKIVDLYEKPHLKKDFNNALLQQGSLRNYELNFRRKDNSLFIGSVSAKLFRNKQGEPLFYDGIIEDVTEQRNANRSLEESRIQYISTLDAFSDLIFMLDRDMNIVLFNKSLQHWLTKNSFPQVNVNDKFINSIPFASEKCIGRKLVIFKTRNGKNYY